MLGIDWLGCLASVGALALLFRGRLRLLRALAFVALLQVGVVAAAVILNGQVTAITAGGLFSGIEGGPSPRWAVTIAGLWVAAVLALPLGSRLRRDGVLGATACSLAILLLS